MKLTRRGKLTLFAAAPAGLALLVAGAAYAYLDAIGVVGASRPGPTTTVVIPHGATLSDAGEILEEKGIVPSALGFRLRVRLDGVSGVEAGRYVLHKNLSAADALAALGRGPEVRYETVTFPEGSTVKDFAATLQRETRLSARDFLAAVKSGSVRSRIQPPGVTSLEGLLFPSTYQVSENDSARTVLARFVETFDEQFSKLDLTTAKKAGLTPYEVVIVASMVEEEAKVPADRGKVARVVYNRLEQGMPLGIDATIQYALGKQGESLTVSDLEADSPYNTRIHTGLPPTPIGSPGMASLRAGAHPPTGDWLYYVVSDCKGHHAFSTDYSDFLVDKEHYQSLSCG
ncbi:MAG TPA: endolytic transglycosylase MltG [Actinomycetota bacterium]|nr:endolytic transglycosylase MltG [Actinomycetota bacterium]